MLYAQIYWLHDFQDEPTQFYAELDADSYEVRKLARYRDGTIAYADEREQSGGTFLSPEPYPPLHLPAEDTSFVINEISAREFEGLWRRRLSSAYGTKT